MMALATVPAAPHILPTRNTAPTMKTYLDPARVYADLVAKKLKPRRGRLGACYRYAFRGAIDLKADYAIAEVACISDPDFRYFHAIAITAEGLIYEPLSGALFSDSAIRAIFDPVNILVRMDYREAARLAVENNYCPPFPELFGLVDPSL